MFTILFDLSLYHLYMPEQMPTSAKIPPIKATNLRGDSDYTALDPASRKLDNVVAFFRADKILDYKHLNFTRETILGFH